MKKAYKKYITELEELEVSKDEPLSSYSSFRLGGPADLFVKVRSLQELTRAISLARNLDIDFFTLGGGTNILIADYGFRGVVIKNETEQIKVKGFKGFGNKDTNGDIGVGTVYIEADSGVKMNRLVRFALDQGLSGLEAFLGQPGTVGGAVYMNAHNVHENAFVSDVVFGATILDCKSKSVKVQRDFFQFGYDESHIQKTEDIVLSALFVLRRGDKKTLWDKATVSAIRRSKTQPVGVASAGCVFRNISKSDAMRLATPGYTCSVGYLLDSVGLKGYMKNGVCFSQSHANFIVHRGSGTASDVVKLIDLAKQRVFERYGIMLVEEVIRIGFPTNSVER